MRRHVPRLELGLLPALALGSALVSGCQDRSTEPERRTARLVSSADVALSALLTPRQTGRFDCVGDVCTQPYPRRPDSGEWRCADSGGVVWCAGGEPAAGVVPGTLTSGFRCGARFGGSTERVCIDDTPDFPQDRAQGYACSFAQERGMTRVCKRTPSHATAPLAPAALPACWLGKDCRSGECDRGACRCGSDQECDVGPCRLGLCAEAP